MRLDVGGPIMECVVALGSWPAFGISILLCFSLFGFGVPKAKAPIFANVGPNLPHKVLDEYFPTWTPQIADTFFASIGPEGRAAYRRFYWTMDFWFPGTAASLATASLMLITFPPSSGWSSWLCLIALASWLCDLAENITHFQMAGAYPNLSSFAVGFGPSFTRAKWVFAIMPLPIASVGLVLRLLHST